MLVRTVFLKGPRKHSPAYVILSDQKPRLPRVLLPKDLEIEPYHFPKVQHHLRRVPWRQASTSNLFIPIVTKTCRDFLVVGQYSRMIDSGEVVSDILREAQCFEVYLTVFDERKGLTWMMNTTTAGPIIKFQANVPEIAWAMPSNRTFASLDPARTSS